MASVKVYEVQPGDVDELFEEGGLLFGFSRSQLTPGEISSDRAQALRDALGRDTDIAVGRLPDGRLCGLDYFRSGPYRIAIEEKE
jgi:hypothetical protein